MYQQKLQDGDLDANLWLLEVDALWKAEMNAYGKDLSSIRYNDPDLGMLVELRYNVHVWAAFKNHSYIGDLVKALRDDQGDIRTFEDFRELAQKLEADYYVQWLRTEYDTAIATGQMAAAWQRMQRQKDLFPYLQYQTAGDERVRREHAALDGATYAVDDDFWNVYFPPNGWNCRCDVIQVAGPGREAASTPEIPDTFSQNPGRSGRIATDAHPYFAQLSAEQRGTLTDLVAEQANRPKNLTPKKWNAELDQTFWRIVREQVPLTITDDDMHRANYDYRNNVVNLGRNFRYNLSPLYRKRVVYHELGHAAHFRRRLLNDSYVDPKLQEAFEACRGHIKGMEQDIEDALVQTLQHLQRQSDDFRWDGYNQYELMDMLATTADDLEALTGGIHGFGHGIAYYMRANHTYMEWFAHACENRYSANPVFKEFMPKVHDTMVKYIMTIE